MKKVSDIFKDFSDEKLHNDLNNSPSLFFFGYSGVSSADLTVLRRDLIASGARMFIIKNSYAILALEKAKKEKEMRDFIDGPTAFVFIEDDPVRPAKILTTFVKSHDSMRLRGGYIRDRILQARDFKVLASIPSRQVLYQQIAVVVNGPLSKLAMDLNQIVTKLCYALKAISEKKGKEAK